MIGSVLDIGRAMIMLLDGTVGLSFKHELGGKRDEN